MLSKRFRSSAPLAVAAACILYGAPVSAQTVPAFEPVDKWQVGATQLAGMRGLNDVSLPCILSNEYDNGFIVRFSGGGGQILAMAIDFRQDVFKQGRKYKAMVSLGDSYIQQVSASAFTANTLIFNLRGLKDFYNAAKDADEMEITIAGNAMKFSLARLGSSYGALEKCYGGAAADVIEPRNAPTETQQPTRNAAAEMPQSYEEIIANAPPAQATGRPMNIAQVTPETRSIPAWNASAGEDIRAVLNRWADRAGYDLQWQADQNGVVAQDLALDGTFEEAVSQLLATSGAASGIAGRIDQSQAPIVAHDPGPVSNNWTAPAGASLQSVLDGWAAQAGVTVVWNTSINAPVKNNLTMSGPFEAAVQSLLDQYADDSARPVGALDTDASGKRTLTVELDRAG